MATGPVDLDKVVAKYVELRDAKKEVEDRHKSELLPYVQAMEQIETFLRRKLDEQGVESSRTNSGTFFKKLNESVTVANRDALYEWAKTHDQLDLLDIRAAKKNILAYKAATVTEENKQGLLPPGVDYRAEIEVQVRRAS
jgi:hypothetical protein